VRVVWYNEITDAEVMQVVHRIYFDACCYNRPFDNQLDGKIKLESEAILLLESGVKANQLDLYSSGVVEYELSQMKDLEKKASVFAFYSSMASGKLEFCNEIEQIADNLDRHNIKYMDALHVAYCEHYGIDYMLTTDKVLLNTIRRVELMTKVINPLEFVMEVL